MKESAYEKGMKLLEEMLGEDRQTYLDKLDSIYEGLGSNITEQVYGNIYAREGLDIKTRQLITVALLLGNAEKEQLLLHTKIALNLGVTKEEITEMILQSITVIGMPKALFALKTVKELF